MLSTRVVVFGVAVVVAAVSFAVPTVELDLTLKTVCVVFAFAPAVL